jgi:hypothetical protein
LPAPFGDWHLHPVHEILGSVRLNRLTRRNKVKSPRTALDYGGTKT